MLHFMLEKLIQKKWMVLSLFAGCILFISIVTLSPVYMHGALQKMLTDRLKSNSLETENYPMQAVYTDHLKYYKKDPASVVEKKEKQLKKELKKIDTKKVRDVNACSIAPQTYSSDTKSSSHELFQLGFVFLPGMEDHIKLVDGENMTTSYQDDDTVKVLVSQSAFQKSKLILGEHLTFAKLVNSKKEHITFEIAGVFEAEDPQDTFWCDSPDSYSKYCFVSEDVFYKICTLLGDSENAGIDYKAWRLYDYEKMKYEESEAVYKQCKKLSSDTLSFSFLNVIETYIHDSHKVETTMYILQLPTILLLLLFIYMVSAKMLSMEQNEIAVLKSRGVYSYQILGIYLLQSVVISFTAAVIGLINACLLAKLIGLSNSFMEFVIRKSLPISLTKRVWGWWLFAFLFCILVMTLPVIPKCKITIVEQKRRNKKKKVFWKRIYLDVIGFVIAGYVYYNFSHQLEQIRQRVRMGESVDPTLFLGSSLFIFSASLFLTRVIPFIISLIYKAGRKKWSVSAYAAFLQSTRNKDKQSFLMIFLVATVALGIFNSNTARTINANEEKNLRYEDGADIILKETFYSNIAGIKYALSKGNTAGPIVYTEPDTTKYQPLAGYVQGEAKVYRMEDISVKGTSDFTGNSNRTAPSLALERGQTMLLGISTKDFGETAYMPTDVTTHHWYNELNKMAPDPYAVLVSTNMQKQFGLEEGDCILYDIYDVLGRNAGFAKGVIVGFVDYFPGFINKDYVQMADGSYQLQDKYLIVSNYDMITSVIGIQPYERWYKNAGDNAYIYDYLEMTPIALEKFIDADNDVVRMKNDPVFQETNGLLTIGFLVSLLICSIGFLIFQIMGMKERELNFGVYRAMGLTTKELKKMLLLEQLFTTLPAAIGGVLTGFIATKLYIPLIDVTYASGTAKSLPAKIIISSMDMLQLGIILVLAFALCMYIVSRIISHMQIAQALKLGEE